MDDVVFEEFKGTGNMELVLDRKLAEKRIFPAINIQRSGTRREDLLLTKEEQEIVYALHRELSGNRADENMEQILKWNPQVIFVQDRYAAEVLPQITKGAAWAPISAVKKHRVYETRD